MSCSRVSWFFAATAIRAKERLHVGARLPPVQPPAVGVAAPHRVHLGQVGVAAPGPGVDQGQQARAVRAGLGAEDPRGGAPLVAVLGEVRGDVRPQVVLLVRLVQGGDPPDGIVEQRHHVRKRVAEEPGDAHCDVDARPAQLGGRHHLDAGDPPGRSSQTGRQPSNASTSAMSSPWVRIALVPHTVKPTERGYAPVSARCRASSESARATPTSQALRLGMAFGSTE